MPAEHIRHDDAPEPLWRYTQLAQDVVARRQQYERESGQNIRPTIARDTPISGGVYEGDYGGRGIVVDADKYPAIDESTDEVMRRITGSDGRPDKHRALATAYQLVIERMRYDKDAEAQISHRDIPGASDEKVALDTYINAGVGICQQQGLYAGAVIERLVKRGVLSGQVSVDRSEEFYRGQNRVDGHVWARYTNSRGEVYIIDPAGHQADSLRNLMQARREGNREVWDYGRPEDHARLRGEIAMNAAHQAQSLAAEAQSDTNARGGGLVDKLRHGGKKERKQSPQEKFMGQRDNVLATLDSIIQNASYMDARARIGSVSEGIGQLMNSSKISPEMWQYLADTQELCDRFNSSGRDPRARGYSDPRAELAQIRSRLAAIR